MIITCGECNSSFVLDDSLIKVSGSKVRCSNCKNVFVVYPAATEPDASMVERPAAPQTKAKAADVRPKAAEKAGAAPMDDPDLTKALAAINEEELDFSDDELGIDVSAAPSVEKRAPAPKPVPTSQPVQEEPELAEAEPETTEKSEVPAEASAPSQEMDIESSLDDEEEDVLDFADFELDMDEGDVPSDVPEFESGVTQELDLAFDEKMVMDDLLGEDDFGSSEEEELDFSDLELELGGESEGSDVDLTEDLESKQAEEAVDGADTVMVDEDGLDFSHLDLEETGDEAPAEDLDLSLDEEPETMMMEEELDFSDLERELDGDAADDMPASEDELDLDLDLDDEDMAAEPETVLLEEEDLDFSEFELEADDGKDTGAAGTEAKDASLDDELDFSELAGILDSDEEIPDLPEIDDDDVDLELDLDSEDADEVEAAGTPGGDEEELDFSDLENLLDGMDDLEETKVEALPEDIDLELDGDLDEDDFDLEDGAPEERVASEEDDLDFSDVEAMLGSDDEEDEDLDLDLDLGGAEPDGGIDLEEDEDLSLSLENEDDSDIELELDLSEDQSSEDEEFEDEGAIPPLMVDEPEGKEAKAADKKKAKKKPTPKRKAKGKGGLVKKLIVAIILLILVLFVLYMSKNKIEEMTDAVIPVNISILENLRDTIGGMEIPFVSSWVKPSPKDPQGKLQLKTTGITGKIIVSEVENLGDLFVISGKVQNNYSSTRNSISLVGKLFGQGGKVVQSKIFYAGNVIPEEELVTMDKDLIKSRLQNRLGDNGVNAKVRPGQIIPFMVVFTDLNENLTEFSVESSGSFQGAAIK